jgi:hypothetical protein
MKFLQVYCENRKTSVYVNIEKIVLLSRDSNEEEQIFSLVEVEGLTDNRGALKVNMAPEDLIKMINGEDKIRIGFRTSH